MRAACALAAAALLACSSVRVLRLSNRSFAPTRRVEFLARPPARPHVEIARLVVSRSRTNNDDIEVVARRLGADAVVRFATLETGMSGTIAIDGGVGIGVSLDEEFFTAIRYLDQEPAPGP